MDLIRAIDLSLTTLMLCFVLPFIYFGYQAKYWYRPDLIKKYDMGLQVASLVLAIVFLVKTATIAKDGWQALQLGILHLFPLVLTLLIIARGPKTGMQNPLAQEESKPDSYTPRPLNKEVEEVGWDQLVMNDDLKQELLSVIELLREPEQAHQYGIDVPKGILFNGPPGTGKTTIAKAVASTAGLSFFALKMDEVVSKWVGESEKNLSKLFQAAVAHAPSVIFIDEVDSIGKQRSGGGQQWAENLLNHLLQLIDGVVKAEGLYVIAATNRADLVDDALKRAGRLNKVIEIALPDLDSRVALFQNFLTKLKLEDNVDLLQLAELTSGKSGADIKEICNQAGLNAFKRESTNGHNREYLVTNNDIQLAIEDFTVSY